jgi:rhodanese-related sulfurtransferase
MSPEACRRDLLIGREIAIIDLREEADFGAGHPLFAANLPLSTLEFTAPERLPRRDVRIVLYDDGDGEVLGRGAEKLRAMGFTDIRQLAGGLAAWRAAGFELFTDLNSYAKAFGELVEANCDTPTLSAADLRPRLAAGQRPVLLDVRPESEFSAGTIPGAVNLPGAEVALQVSELAPNSETLVLVTCAGRTRGLIAAQTLLNLGIPNPVAAVRDGTMGWRLAGYNLADGDQLPPDAGRSAAPSEGLSAARALAYRAGVKRLTQEDLAALLADNDRTLYCFDVRPRADFLRGHPPGFRHAPGGQLIQEIDRFAPVRGAAIILSDDLEVRAASTASWLAQMGFDTAILEDGFDGPLEVGPSPAAHAPPPDTAEISIEALEARLIAGDIKLLDLASSQSHALGHIPKARFAVRARLPLELMKLPRTDIAMTSHDGVLAQFAAAEVSTEAERRTFWLTGGTRAWRATGRPLATGISDPLSPLVDIYRRPHEGVDPAASMRAYLDWEHGLVEQLARDGTHGFRVLSPPRHAPARIAG